MKKASGSSILWNYLINHVGEELDLKTLTKISEKHGLHYWDRVIRRWEEDGADIINERGKWYMLRSVPKEPLVPKRKGINKKLRFLILERDNFTCQACGRTPKDRIKLVIDHIVPIAWGGETSQANLQALCDDCNSGKQAWINGEDAKIMEHVCKQSNAEDRLHIYFAAHPNEELSVLRLAVVAKTREWTRQIRFLRKKNKMNIKYMHKSKTQTKSSDCYVYLTT